MKSADRLGDGEEIRSGGRREDEAVVWGNWQDMLKRETQGG